MLNWKMLVKPTIQLAEVILKLLPPTGSAVNVFVWKLGTKTPPTFFWIMMIAVFYLRTTYTSLIIIKFNAHYWVLNHNFFKLHSFSATVKTSKCMFQKGIFINFNELNELAWQESRAWYLWIRIPLWFDFCLHMESNCLLPVGFFWSSGVCLNCCQEHVCSSFTVCFSFSSSCIQYLKNNYFQKCQQKYPTRKNIVIFWKYKCIPLTNGVQGLYCKLRTSLFMLQFMAFVRCTTAMNLSGKTRCHNLKYGLRKQH